MYDLVGVGFGPANLALATCLHERNASGNTPTNAVFLEKNPTFSWHREMLLDGATLQVSFIKDLATLRDPTSPFSFLNYLRQQGRLVDFANLRTFFPTRLEFNDYFCWAAAQVREMVRYGAFVTKIEPVLYRGVIDCVELHVQERQRAYSIRARNVVAAIGRVPRVPDCARLGPRVFHSSAFLQSIEPFMRMRGARVLVVGGGQSGAEIVNFLYENCPGSRVVALCPSFGYKPADESYFVNRLFDPDSVSSFYDSPDTLKEYLLEQHRDTNYGATDLELIDALARKFYHDKCTGGGRLELINLARLTGLSSTEHDVTAGFTTRESSETQYRPFDAVVLATGYMNAGIDSLLPREFRAHMEQLASGELRLDRSYAVRTRSSCRARIYLQGYSDDQHGLTNSLLSVMAIRSQEILEDIERHSSGTADSRELAAND